MNFKRKSARYGAVLSALFICGAALAVAATRLPTNRTAAAGGARPEVQVTLGGEVERDGKRLRLEEGVTVRPGEVVRWRVVSSNKGEAPARSYAAEAQVPAGMELIAGSPRAAGGAEVLYSIDHGESFSARPLIEQRGEDGVARMVPAPVSMYTDLRYRWPEELAPGASVEATYEVRVR